MDPPCRHPPKKLGMMDRYPVFECVFFGGVVYCWSKVSVLFSFFTLHAIWKASTKMAESSEYQRFVQDFCSINSSFWKPQNLSPTEIKEEIGFFYESLWVTCSNSQLVPFGQIFLDQTGLKIVPDLPESSTRWVDPETWRNQLSELSLANGTARSCCCHVTNPKRIAMFFFFPVPFKKNSSLWKAFQKYRHHCNLASKLQKVNRTTKNGAAQGGCFEGKSCKML